MIFDESTPPEVEVRQPRVSEAHTAGKGRQ